VNWSLRPQNNGGEGEREFSRTTNSLKVRWFRGEKSLSYVFGESRDVGASPDPPLRGSTTAARSKGGNPERVLASILGGGGKKIGLAGNSQGREKIGGAPTKGGGEITPGICKSSGGGESGVH